MEKLSGQGWEPLKENNPLMPDGPRCRKATVSEAPRILSINLDGGASAKVAFLATEIIHIAGIFQLMTT